MVKTEYLDNKEFEVIIESFQATKREKTRQEMISEDLQETQDRRSKKSDKRGKETMVSHIAKYKDVVVQHDNNKGKLAEQFLRLATNTANFYGRVLGIDVDDATQEGVLICFEKIDRFNPNYKGKDGQKAKAFNYLTTCIFNHYRQIYRTMKNYSELKRRYHQFLQDNFEKMFQIRGKNAYKSSCLEGSDLSDGG
jgi:DNA-directed RNA polymerase specialized sigma subunit